MTMFRQIGQSDFPGFPNLSINDDVSTKLVVWKKAHRFVLYTLSGEGISLFSIISVTPPQKVLEKNQNYF